MADNDVLIRFRSDISNLTSGIETVIAQFNTLFRELGNPAILSGLDARVEALKRGFGSLTSELENTYKRAQTLGDVLSRLRREDQITITLKPEEQELLGGIGGKNRRIEVRRARRLQAEAVKQIEEQIVSITKQKEAAERRILDIARQYPVIYQRVLQLSEARAAIEERIRLAQDPTLDRALLQERRREIDQRIEALQTELQIIRRQAAQLTGRRQGSRLASKEVELAAKELSIKERIEAINRRIAEITKQSSDTEAKSAVLAAENQRRILDLQERRAILQKQLADVEAQRKEPGGPEARIDELVRRSGAAPRIAQIEAELERLRLLDFEALTGGVGTFAPELANLRAELTKIEQLRVKNLNNAEKLREIERQRYEILRKIEQVQREAATRGLPEVLSPEEVRRRQIAQLTGLEKLLFRSFDDVGRRFQATLQFAVSGALIFGVQQLVREFIQAAVEVERTFADTASALEFDFADRGILRGTARFDRELERIRREVLVLSNEFNTLPTVANEAAFKMIARFGETGDALKAIRAQLLATKVSTIDQAEAIRALSATAEGFADALLDVNNGLSLQEKLLERERAAANNYGKALDNAVFLQQRFGVDVEDTLEGTARMAETFRSLGFTLEQTNAIVATVSRTLGQTGVNVAERLNRSLGAIATPAVRDELLELARTSEALNLSLQDFRTGADAFAAIANQMERIQRLEPGTASRIISIIGQRRETEVVAALLGADDLRRAMEVALEGAAGAAERRFGFLAATISEQIQSIIAQFQSLAQNFERLGFLSTLKAFLSLVEGTISGLNRIIQLMINAFEKLDQLGESFGVKLGTVVRYLIIAFATAKSLVATMQAVATLVAVGTAAKEAVIKTAAVGAATSAPFKLLAGATLATNLRGLSSEFKDAQGRVAGLSKSLSILARAIGALGIAAANQVGLFLTQTKVIGPAFSRLQGVLGLSTTALGAWAIGIGAAVFAVAEFVTSIDDAREAAQFVANVQRQAAVETQKQARREPFATEQERQLAQLRNELDILRARVETAQVRGGIAAAIAGRLPLFDPATLDEIGFGRAIVETMKSVVVPGAAGVDPELVVNSRQYWERKILEADRAFSQAQAEVMIQQLRAAGDDTGLTEVLARRLFDVVAEIQNAQDRVDLDNAKVTLQEIEVEVQSFFDQLGLTAQVIEDTVTGIKNDLADIQSRRTLGRISAVQGVKEIEQLIKRAEAKRLDLEGYLERGIQIPDLEDQIKEVVQLEADLASALQGEMQKAIDVIIRRAQLGGGEADRLRVQISVLRQHLSRLTEGTDEAIDVQLQIAELQQQLADLVSDQAAQAARARLSLARTSREWFQASEDLVRELLKQAGQLYARGDFFGAQQKINEALEQRNQAFERFVDELSRKAAATIRKARPIESSLAQVDADIAALRSKIQRGDLDVLPLLEAQINLAELMARRVRIVASAAAEATRLQAGVNDTIRNLQAEITIVSKQLDITARLMGKQSEEWFSLKIRQEQLKQEMVTAQLELEDLNRRLQSDVTDPFQQAQLDLVDIIRQLSELDLGDLERSRLELEKKEAEAAREREFFNDRLFQLKFRFETGELGLSGYLSALQRLLDTVDTSTRQGQEIFLEIQSIINGLTESLQDMVFNVPTQIRLPTLFEVRRAVAADQLGVNYLDNRVQYITLQISNEIDLQSTLSIIDDAFGTLIDSGFVRFGTGDAGITTGAF